MANVAPGSYTLAAHSMKGGRETLPLSGYQTLEVGQHDVENVTVTLVPGVTIKGKVTVEGSGKPRTEPMRVALSPVLPPIPGAFANPQNDGSFAVANVAPGRYRVNVMGAGDSAFVKPVKLGGLEIGNREFEIAGGAAPEMAILLSTEAGQVTGRVKGPAGPVPEATVVIAGGNGEFRNATTAEDGSFAIGGLAPGEYKFYAWEDVETGAWQEREFLNRYANRALTITAGAGKATNLLAGVIPAGQ